MPVVTAALFTQLIHLIININNNLMILQMTAYLRRLLTFARYSTYCSTNDTICYKGLTKINTHNVTIWPYIQWYLDYLARTNLIFEFTFVKNSIENHNIVVRQKENCLVIPSQLGIKREVKQKVLQVETNKNSVRTIHVIPIYNVISQSYCAKGTKTRLLGKVPKTFLFIYCGFLLESEYTGSEVERLVEIIKRCQPDYFSLKVIIESVVVSRSRPQK